MKLARRRSCSASRKRAYAGCATGDEDSRPCATPGTRRKPCPERGAASPGQSATEPARAAPVLEIWQELVGATLSPDSVRRCRAHPDFTVLCHYDRRRLDAAGRQLYGRTGKLL